MADGAFEPVSTEEYRERAEGEHTGSCNECRIEMPVTVIYLVGVETSTVPAFTDLCHAFKIKSRRQMRPCRL